MSEDFLARLEAQAGDSAEADILARLYEATLSSDRRKHSGAHYTPLWAARKLLDWATEGFVSGPWKVFDPAVGGGTFLLAAAQLQLARGAPAIDVASGLGGTDIDAAAVAVAGRGLERLLGAAPSGLRVADGLIDPIGLDDQVDLVVGNPPFLSQLAAATTRSRGDAAALLDRFGPVAKGYVDTAALFVLAGMERLRPGGRLVLLVPQSVMGAAHTERMRRRVEELASLHSVWIAPPKLFSAAVNVAGIVIEKGAVIPSIRLAEGTEFEPKGSIELTASNWSPLLAKAWGVPSVEGWQTSGVVGDVATATAGFRQLHYALVDAAFELEASREAGFDEMKVATTAAVDPCVIRWGQRRMTLGGKRFIRPAVRMADLNTFDPSVGRWVALRRRPKLILAPQTRVIEAALDPAGEFVPSTPLVSIETIGDNDPIGTLWRLLAVLCAPPVSAWVAAEVAGTARAPGAIKMSAKQTVQVPLPAFTENWQGSADRLAEGADIADIAEDMCLAYGLSADHSSMSWWMSRLPGPIG